MILSSNKKMHDHFSSLTMAFLPTASIDNLRPVLFVFLQRGSQWMARKGLRATRTAAEIQSWWNVPSEARIEPPSQGAYFRSTVFAGAWMRIRCCFRVSTASLKKSGRKTDPRGKLVELPGQPVGHAGDQSAWPNENDVGQKLGAHIGVGEENRLVS